MHQRITEAEAKVLELLSKGCTAAEIAASLKKSLSTVKTLKKRALIGLGAERVEDALEIYEGLMKKKKFQDDKETL